MSRHDKDPREKHDPSKSGSSSDELSEQELEHLTMEPTTDESKLRESPKQGPSIRKGDPLNEPTAGPSGLQESRLESADLESKSRNLGARPKEKKKLSSKTDADPTIYENFPRMDADPTIYENFPRTDADPTIYENFPRTDADPTIYENFPQSIAEGESQSQSSEPGIPNYIPSNSDNTESTSPVVCQSSTGISPPYRQEGAVGGADEFHPEGLFRRQNVLDRLGYQSDSEGPQLRRAAYANDSQNTSSDASEIRSEMADISAEASAYPKEFPISVLARQSTGTSDTSGSTSASFEKTTSKSMVERLTQSFPADATRRDSETGIKSEPSKSKIKREDLRESKKTIADMQKQRDKEDAGRMVASQSCPELPSRSQYPEKKRSYSVGMQRSESSETESLSETEASTYLKETSISDFETQSTETSDTGDGTLASSGTTTSESMDERLTQSFPDVATRRDSGSGIESEPSPSKRKREDLRESKGTDKDIADMRRQRDEKDEAKMVASQSCPDLRSSSKCPEPERSYSVGMPRRESSETESLSEVETSKLEEGRKPYQKAGQLKALQQSTISSGDSFASEEARSSPSREQDPSVETRDPIPEKMETSPEKGDESATENVDSERGEKTKVVGQSTEESKRSAKKSKRDPQLSSSSQSEDTSDSSPTAETSRPKKKARGDGSTSEDDTTLVSEYEKRTRC